jgi:hypothetical protein
MRSLVVWAIVSHLSNSPALALDDLPRPNSDVVLTITGRIDRTNGPRGAEFDREMLQALGVVEIRTTTTFTDGLKIFEGVPLAQVLARVGARGTVLRAQALNDYSTKLDMDDLKYEPVLALRMNGVPLTARDKGPLWIVFPRDQIGPALSGPQFDQKWVWQLNRLHIE